MNYLYGSFQVLCGLQRVSQDMKADWVQRAGQWLKDHQQLDGSFGESANSYEDPSLEGQGPATASQTAWPASPAFSTCATASPSRSWRSDGG